MKLFIAAVCIFGIAFVASAPAETDSQSIENENTDGAEGRAAEIPQINPADQEHIIEKSAAEEPEAEDRELSPIEEKAAETPVDEQAAMGAERALPFAASVRDLVRSLENKFFTEDGKALIRTIFPKL